MNNIIIRPYQEKDRAAVRDIAYATAFFGESGKSFFTDPEILSGVLTAYFTDCEPSSCFVAETDSTVIGYLIGAKNANKILGCFFTKIAPGLFLKSIWRGTIFKLKNLKFIYHFLRSYFQGEFDLPESIKLYPATLHINVRDGYRNSGIGAKLIDAYCQFLVQEKIDGVHLLTMSENASRFFQQQGFTILKEGKRTYFRYLLNKDIPIYLCGKKLS
jgi:ribosomal protein S18 acetylase RimI-like enzyme